MNLLRFTTAGSVDDGKSTLIGRLLYDSKSIFQDQLDAIEQASASRGKDEVDLALLTDGLRAEREQGITIDVAYRYFSTPKRKFIIADTPGHVQYTRNMVTGASTADVALILVDAQNGILEQTIRHTNIAALLGLSPIIVCINKMDLVGFSEERYNEIVAQYRKQFSQVDAIFVPISAKLGDNVVNPSANMPWYDGRPLLELLETIEINTEGRLAAPFRMSVQTVIRPNQTFRGFAGRISSGKIAVGDEISVFPGKQTATISALRNTDGETQTASAGESIVVCLDREIDISRGTLLAAPPYPTESNDIEATVCWLRETPLIIGKRYILRQETNEVVAIVRQGQPLQMNDIATVRFRTAKPIFFDPYINNRTTGSFIIIDPDTNDTIAAAMIK